MKRQIFASTATLRYTCGMVLLLLFLFGCMTYQPPDREAIAVRGSSSSSGTVLIIPKNHSSENSAPTVVIDWLSPTSADLSVKTVGDKVEIKLRINSKTPVELSQIDILVNGKPAGNKADEVGLMRRPKFEDQILTAQVPVAEGLNAIKVLITLGADQVFFSECSLEKGTEGIQITNASPATSDTRVVWTQPLLEQNKVFSTKGQELEVRFNITSPHPVKLEDLQIQQNKILRAPSPVAEFSGSNGVYYFKDVLTLKEEIGLYDISLKVNVPGGSVSSQTLPVNFSPVRPNLYILSIGTELNLKYARKDAGDFANIFASQMKDMYRLYNSVIVDTLLGKAATTQSIRIAVESIKNKIRTGTIAEDDVVMLFLSSHGFNPGDDFRIQGDDYDPSGRMSTSISYPEDVLSHLQNLPCKKLIFIDACHSGGAKANPADINQALMELKTAPNEFAVFTSCSEEEESYEDVYWANGAFTEALILGLKNGEADGPGYGNGNGIITLGELEAFVTQRVPVMVNAVKNKSQHPKVSRNDLGNIPIFIVKK